LFHEDENQGDVVQITTKIKIILMRQTLLPGDRLTRLKKIAK